MSKKTILFLLIVIIVVAGILFSQKGTNVAQAPDVNLESGTEAVELCFAQKTPTASGLSDEYNLVMSIAGEDVEGSFQYMPAEKDQKTGSFVGTAGPLNQATMSREATLWWSTMAEGMLAKEELAVRFGDGSAAVGFGEMVAKEDGTYAYKDKTKLFWLDIPQVACS